MWFLTEEKELQKRADEWQADQVEREAGTLVHGAPIGRCDWLIHAGYDEFGQQQVIECEALTFETAIGGYRCEAGHEHVPIEIAYAPFGLAWEREQMEREQMEAMA